MSRISVHEAQAPLRALYKSSPQAARVTDHALTTGADPGDPLHSAEAAPPSPGPEAIRHVMAAGMKPLLFLAALLAGFSAYAADLPYSKNADAKTEIRLALAQARTKPVLLLFGANWCEDCRALDRALKTGKNASLIAREFTVVKIDVGNFDRNLDVVANYGNPIAKGIPAAVILSPGNKVLYSTRAGELSNARRMNEEGIYGFFRKAIENANGTR